MDIKTEAPMTIATIQAFRKMLDIMEEFVRNTESEKLKELSEASEQS